ncbi:MAG: hypothetical protein AAFX87_21260 [Bacteroidota bacterium]
MKSLRLIFIICFAAITSAGYAQVVGKTFPDLEGETVNNKKITLPKDTNDKYTLVGLAYSKKSEGDLNTWYSPVYNKFVYKSEKPSLFSSFQYDVNVFFVPMFTGVNAAAKGVAKKKALKKVDPKLFPHILFYKGKLKPYKQALDFEKKDIPYFFVLDKAGKIIYATSGRFTDKKLGEIESVLEED